MSLNFIECSNLSGRTALFVWPSLPLGHPNHALIVPRPRYHSVAMHCVFILIVKFEHKHIMAHDSGVPVGLVVLWVVKSNRNCKLRHKWVWRTIMLDIRIELTAWLDIGIHFGELRSIGNFREWQIDPRQTLVVRREILHRGTLCLL